MTEQLPPLIVRALQLVARIQVSNDRAHGMDHVESVIRNCITIFREHKCNEDIVLLAACLHDVVPRAGLSVPADASDYSAISSKNILASLNVSEVVAAQVSECIRTASWEHHVKGGTPGDVNSYVLRDADLLESVGARGIARVFAFAGAHNLPLNWTSIDVRQPRRERPDAGGMDENPFQHFETKLLWVRELMFSATAKKEAELRHRVLLQFLKHYAAELEWGN